METTSVLKRVQVDSPGPVELVDSVVNNFWKIICNDNNFQITYQKCC